MSSNGTSAISVRGLGKQYRIGGQMPAFPTLRDAVARRLRGRRRESSRRELIWALREVSFDVQPGEALGIIGANGAGKTTLLKILSRITDPSTGEAIVRGRAGSLLEVGTGFHPELTGRENIYLNGAILGMRRHEINSKFEEIVSFAGVERFIDTPVKRYSSGMYVRLAFAVAAHLDADILLVDEVLSVGDFGFQRRSLGKMQEQTQSEGRTVLFVSHNLGAIKTLTTRCLWLEQGHVRGLGPTEEVFRDYVLSHAASGGGTTDLTDLSVGRARKALAHTLSFARMELLDGRGSIAETHLEGEILTIRFLIRAHSPLGGRQLQIRCRVSTVDGILLFSAVSDPQPIDIAPGLYETSVTLDPNPLAAGTYSIGLYMLTMGDETVDLGQDLLPSAATFRIEANPTTETYMGEQAGLVRVEGQWGTLAPANPLEILAAPPR